MKHLLLIVALVFLVAGLLGCDNDPIWTCIPESGMCPDS